MKVKHEVLYLKEKIVYGFVESLVTTRYVYQIPNNTSQDRLPLFSEILSITDLFELHLFSYLS